MPCHLSSFQCIIFKITKKYIVGESKQTFFVNKQDKLFWNHQFCKSKTIDGNARTRSVFLVIFQRSRNLMCTKQNSLVIIIIRLVLSHLVWPVFYYITKRMFLKRPYLTFWDILYFQIRKFLTRASKLFMQPVSLF